MCACVCVCACACVCGLVGGWLVRAFVWFAHLKVCMHTSICSFAWGDVGNKCIGCVRLGSTSAIHDLLYVFDIV